MNCTVFMELYNFSVTLLLNMRYEMNCIESATAVALRHYKGSMKRKEGYLLEIYG